MRLTPEILRRHGRLRSKVAHLIRYELRTRGHSTMTVAAELGISPQCVNKAINGHTNSQRVLATLRALGVPEKYLYDPHLFLQQQQEQEAV